MNVSTPVKEIGFILEVEAMIVGGSVPVPYTWNIKSLSHIHGIPIIQHTNQYQSFNQSYVPHVSVTDILL